MIKELFGASSPFSEPGKPLNAENKFVERLSQSLKGVNKALFITSDTDNVEFTEDFSFAIRETMEQYNGVVLGISAGTMNSADLVYAQPEIEGEASDKTYKKFLVGLNLTKCMILPHYQDTKNQILDGKRLFEEITYPDSHGKTFYALPDGSDLYSADSEEKICGEAYQIKDGKCIKVCSKGEEITIN